MLNFDYFYNQLPTHGSLDRVVEASLELAIECITKSLEPTDTSDALVYGFERIGLLRKAHAYFKKELTHSVIEGVVFAALANKVGYKAARGSVISVAGYRFFDNLELALKWIDMHTDNSLSATDGLVLQAPLARRASPSGARYGSSLFAAGLSLAEYGCRKLVGDNNIIAIGSRVSCSVIEPAKALSARSFISLIYWTVNKADLSGNSHLAIAIPARLFLILLGRALRLACRPSIPILVFRRRVSGVSAANEVTAVVDEVEQPGLMSKALTIFKEEFANGAIDGVAFNKELNEATSIVSEEYEVQIMKDSPENIELSRDTTHEADFEESHMSALFIDESDHDLTDYESDLFSDSQPHHHSESSSFEGVTEVDTSFSDSSVCYETVHSNPDYEGDDKYFGFTNDGKDSAENTKSECKASIRLFYLQSISPNESQRQPAIVDASELAAETSELLVADAARNGHTPSVDQIGLMSKALSFFKEERVTGAIEGAAVNKEDEATSIVPDEPEEQFMKDSSEDTEVSRDTTLEADVEEESGMSTLFIDERDDDLNGKVPYLFSDSQLDHSSGNSSSEDATEVDTSFSDSSVCETTVYSPGSEGDLKSFTFTVVEKNSAEVTVSEDKVSFDIEPEPQLAISHTNAVGNAIVEKPTTEAIKTILQDAHRDDVPECNAFAKVKRRSFFPQTDTTVSPALLELTRRFPPTPKPAKPRHAEREVPPDPFNYKLTLPSITDYQESWRTKAPSQPKCQPQAPRFGWSSLDTALPASYPRERASSEEQTLDWIIASRFRNRENPFEKTTQSPSIQSDKKPLLDKFGYPIVSKCKVVELDTIQTEAVVEEEDAATISEIVAASLPASQPPSADWHGAPTSTDAPIQTDGLSAESLSSILDLNEAQPQPSPLLAPDAPAQTHEDEDRDYRWPQAHFQLQDGWQTFPADRQLSPSPSEIAPQLTTHETYESEEPVADFEAIGEPDVWEPTAKESRRRLSPRSRPPQHRWRK